MELLYKLGLLFLNFTILNILLSIVFFCFSVAGKRLLSSPRIKSRLFFIAMIAPPALAAFTIFASFVPPVFVRIPGKPMFCFSEAYCYIFSFVSPEMPMFNGLLLSATALAVLPLLYSAMNLRSYIRTYAMINRLDSSTASIRASIRTELSNDLRQLVDIYNVRIKVIDTSLMVSFVWGYKSNTIVLSTGVLRSLSKDELRGLLAHELSHYKRKDNILKGILMLCRNISFILPHVYYMLRWWRKEIELIGDETAALCTGHPLDVASALLKMQALPASYFHRNLRSYATGFNISENAGLFTERVERLVAINDRTVRTGKKSIILPSELSALVGMVSIFTLIFIAISGLNPLLLHCYLEKLISLI